MLTLKILFIVGAVIALVILLIVGSTLYWFATKQVRREIARNVLISTEWLDLSPRPPLEVKYDLQNVYLAIEGYKYKLGTPLTPIKLPDGTEVNPEIRLLDEYGQVYNLKGLTILGSMAGFSADLPRGRVYTGVKIRADKPLRCSKVYWECSRMK